MEVHNSEWEAMTKTIPKKNQYKKVKWFSKEALKIAENRRKAKGKGYRERYTNRMQSSRE